MSETMIVIGGGLVGAAIAYGSARAGLRVTLLDQGDQAFRASRGNFGLVWVQSKGHRLTPYARWCRDAVHYWPRLQNDLMELTGVDAGLEQTGGFWLGFSDADVVTRERTLADIDRDAGGVPFQMMDRAQLLDHLPGLGPTVVGGSYCPLDGHASPLGLLHALHAGLVALGADVISGVNMTQLCHLPGSGGFEAVAANGQRWKGDRIVIAAGLGNTALARQVGLHAPMVSERGQILVTERLQPFLRHPTNKLRQTKEGSVQIGSSSEDVGLNEGVTADVVDRLARRAVATFPALENARLVRAWGALRPLTPDTYPIYQESPTCPGAFVATTHSGVSLAAAHAMVVAPWMCGLSSAPEDFQAFRGERFIKSTIGSFQ